MRWMLVLLAACAHHAPAVVDVGEEGTDEITVEEPARRGVLEQALHVLGSMRTTKYAHGTVIDVAAGHYELDCSGFVGYVLAHAQPAAFAALRATTRQRPLAKHFVAYIQALPDVLLPDDAAAWQRLGRADELAPGDIIAWLKPDDVVSKNTGHVMIVRATPRRHERHPDVWIVPIIDSTGVPHGRGDSRKASGITGLGTGEILLVVDERGAPIGYRWSQGTKATLHLTAIAIARVNRIERTSPAIAFPHRDR